MNDDLKTRETLSALLDGEANELEVQRLLKQPIPSDALAAMRRYQSVRAVIAGHRQVATFDISARVADAVRKEPALNRPQESTAHESATKSQFGQPARESAKAGADRSVPADRKARRQLLGGFAVAATVAFAVILSPQLLRDGPSESPVQVAQAPAIPSQSFVQLPQPSPQAPAVARLQQEAVAPVAAPVAAERPLNEEHMRRLNEYLMRHAEHAALNNGQGVVPFARLAGFESPQNPQR